VIAALALVALVHAFVVPTLPVYWPYAVAVLVAALRLPPRPVAALSLLALALYVIVSLLKGTPGGADPALELFHLAGLALLSAMAILVAHLRQEATRHYRQAQEELTERKRVEAALEHRATHDPLTNLANRAFFVDALHHAMLRAARRERPVAVLFLDLDRFKVINDSLGHSVGDQLLVAVANRLRSCLRGQDVAARLGGDEFTVLLEDVNDVQDAARVAERILAAMEAPFLLDGQEVFVTTSIGIALGRPGRPAGPAAQRDLGGLATALLRDADVAMYRAKQKGKARYEVFDPSMRAGALERLQHETDLRRALERQEFRVNYQPVINLGAGRGENSSLVAMEALIRWQHPRRGLLPPEEFLPLAEETGLIVPIGRWVLEVACLQARAWREEYPDRLPIAVAVNLSARQFQQPNLAADIAAILRETGCRPQDLILEITEGVVMHDVHSSIRTLQALKALGVRLAVDDFGTGYSSLSYLKRFPVDTLKIDRSFVGALGQDPEDTAIVAAIIRLGHALELQVTAEGVETADQLRRLRSLECDAAQGYYLAAPSPSAAAVRFAQSAARTVLARGTSN
jgi:diguanylate cyclase (GGDEF)-like protein